MLLANFNRKEHLRHRAVSLRQHGFLVRFVTSIIIATGPLVGTIIAVSDLNNASGGIHILYQ